MVHTDPLLFEPMGALKACLASFLGPYEKVRTFCSLVVGGQSRGPSALGDP